MSSSGKADRHVPNRGAVVVGGGIGGLSAARALQQAGWSVQVLERARRLDPLGAGISLWPNAVVALDALGVPMRDRAASYDVGGVRASRGRWLSRSRPSSYPARYGAPLVAVHRGELQQALLASLLPDTVLTGALVIDIREDADLVDVQHSRGTTRADLVVLADGLASSTRHLVTGPLPRPVYAGYTAWRGVTTAEADLPVGGGASESWGRGQRFGIVPLADGRTYWFATATAAEGQHALEHEHAAVLARFADWHEPIQHVVRATHPAAVLRHDVYDLRPHPSRYVRGRLVLVGDAAHAMTPNLGQGACQALEDSATLGALTRPGTSLRCALARYDSLRRPRAQLVSRRSRQVGRLGQLDGQATTAARDLLLRAVPTRLADRQLDAILCWRPGP